MKITPQLLAITSVFVIAAFMNTACTDSEPVPGAEPGTEPDSGEPAAAEAGITKKPFGSVDGQEVQLYTLTNASGFQVSITNYGGIVTSILAPDDAGNLADVALGYNQAEDYVAGSPYFGCITGRYANRIAKAKFELDGTEHTLAANNGENHLHGGEKGFDKYVWTAKSEVSVDGPALILTHTSPDGDEGYPGALTMKVTYTVTADNGLKIDYAATTDQPTVVNLTNHTYFNLAGEGSGKTVLDHTVQIDAGRFTPTDAGGIPSGIASLDGSPLDFRKSTAIGERLDQDDEQLKNGIGYDHNFVLEGGQTAEPRLVATVKEPETGRVLEVLTDQPGLQFYIGNYLDGTNVGKSGKAYEYRTGLCLEAQVFPDSPNQHGTEGYTSARLNPGETYTQTTIYRFRAE